jgi:hypothetical protein
MATFLDVSILGHFTAIFTFLLVFVIVFGMLEVFKLFGEGHRGLHAMVALAIGFIVMFSQGVVTVIQTFTPWFTIVIMLIFFIIFAVRMFGISAAEVTAGFHNNSVILTFILIFAAIIILFSLGAGFGQSSLESGATPGTVANTVNTTNVTAEPGSTATNSFSQNLYNTIYNPKVLGLILVMMIAVIAMLFLTSKEGG